jgi:hypothetical protein
MPQKKITFKPGVNQENTRYVTEGGWYDCDKIRFRQGFPEKIGGWAAISVYTFVGVCRSLWNWITLGGLNLLGVGTNLKFYIQSGGQYYDVTPLRYVSSNVVINNAFTTIATSSQVQVTVAGINLFNGDIVNIYGITSAVNGIPASFFNTQFSVTRINANSFYIQLPTNATSSGVSGGIGSLTYFSYYLPIQNITTTNLSNQVTINATTNGCLNNDYVYFPTVISYNGVTISGWYQVSSVGPSSYVITASTNATGSGTNTLSGYYVQYQINTGSATAIPIVGWGAGGWGSGTWGNGTSSTQQLQLWSQANFGENLIFGPRGGGMYYWVSQNGVANIAYNLTQVYGGSDVPLIQNNIIISDSSRFVLALGCNDYGLTSLNPMLIRWSDQESVSQWTPKSTNQAGSLQLSHGSTIVGSIQSRQEIIVFTDSSVYSLQYLGPPAVWGSTLVGDNTSILSPNAMALASGVVYWMGNGKFYTYNGTVQTLRCDLRQFIFGNINQQQSYQIFAGTNEAFNEVWWFYCSANSTQIDTYVIYNYVDDAWYFGYLGRTAWTDIGLNQYPVAATYINNLVYHEYGVDDNSTSTSQPIDAYIQSSEFDIEDGDRFSFVWQLLPDVRFTGSTISSPQITMSLYGLQNSGSGLNSPTLLQAGTNIDTIVQGQKAVPASGSNSIVSIEKFTGTVPVRVRGRQLIFRIEGNQLGLQWQLGAPRINIRADGRRGDT